MEGKKFRRPAVRLLAARGASPSPNKTQPQPTAVRPVPANLVGSPPAQANWSHLRWVAKDSLEEAHRAGAREHQETAANRSIQGTLLQGAQRAPDCPAPLPLLSTSTLGELLVVASRSLPFKLLLPTSHYGVQYTGEVMVYLRPF